MSEEAARSRAAMFGRVDAALSDRGLEPAHRFHVPGRIEVLGKHTDYAGGRSLLAAVEHGFAVGTAPREDALVRLIDVGRGSEVTLALDPLLAVTTPHWAIYPAAVARRLARDFDPPLRGAEVAFISDLPPSSGLSSSSALLVATFEALRLANHLDGRADFGSALPGVLDVAAYLGSVESGRPFRGFGGEAGVGTEGGSQDHTAILASQASRLCRFGFAPVRVGRIGGVACRPHLRDRGERRGRPEDRGSARSLQPRGRALGGHPLDLAHPQRSGRCHPVRSRDFKRRRHRATAKGSGIDDLGFRRGRSRSAPRSIRGGKPGAGPRRLRSLYRWAILPLSEPWSIVPKPERNEVSGIRFRRPSPSPVWRDLWAPMRPRPSAPVSEEVCGRWCPRARRMRLHQIGSARTGEDSTIRPPRSSAPARVRL